MTEDEAKTRWCPFARLHCEGVEHGAANRGYAGRPDTGALCIASACMAWRVLPLDEVVMRDNGQAEDWIKAGWTKAIRVSDGAFVVTQGGGGFCGLAGRPS